MASLPTSVRRRRPALLPLAQPPPALRHRPHARPHRAGTVCSAAGSGGKKAKQQQEVEEDEEEDDVIYLEGDEDEEGGWLNDLDEEEDGGFGDEDDGWLDDDDDYFGGGDDGGEGGDSTTAETAPVPGSVSIGGAPWGADALAAARAALAATPGGAPTTADDTEGDLRLYSLRCFASPARVDVRLDKLSDVYGSPALEDIDTFSRRFATALEEALGADAAGAIVLEVSSPGAERILALPVDLPRFAALPLRVEFDPARVVVEEAGGNSGKRKSGKGGKGEAAAVTAEPGQQQQQQQQQQAKVVQNAAAAAGVAVLELAAVDEAAGMTEWRLANVRANAPAKGRGLSRRQREQKWMLPLDALQRVRVHVDF